MNNMNHRMNPTRCVLALALLLQGSMALATTYYVSPDGNDANNGTSAATAWQTIARVNQMTYTMQPGDQVLFQRGGTFRGTLHIGSSGTSGAQIVFGAYGNGARPVISGSKVVSGWTPYQGNIWMAPVSGTVKHVYAGGTLMTLARYPNTGWMRNANGTTSMLQSPDITQANGHWNGAELVVRGANWSYDIATVNSHSGNQLNFTAIYNHLDTMHWGFFLRNKLSELDSPGEWYHDANAGMLYFRAPGNVDPNTLFVEAATRDRGAWVYMNNHHVKLDGLQFKHQHERAVFIDAAHHVTVQNCGFQDLYMGLFSYGHNNTIGTNSFTRTYGNGITLLDNNTTIENNTFDDIAMQPGLGESNWGYMALRVQGNDNMVRGNQLHTIGYIGISVHGNTTVEHNFVQNALALLNDGCGIGMENADGVIIRDNIILDIEGNLESAAPNSVTYWKAGMGVYFGNISVMNTLVQNNTIANCSAAGIHVDHTMVSTGNQIKDNTLFNNKMQLSISDFSNYNGPGATPPYHVPSYNTIYSGNIMYSLKEDQLCMFQQHVWGQNLVDFGNFSNNFYFNPYNEMSIELFNHQAGWRRHYSLEQWRGVLGEDLNSSRSTKNLQAYAVTNVLSANLLTNGNFDQNTNGWQGWPAQGTLTHDLAFLDNGAAKVHFSDNSFYHEYTLRNSSMVNLQNGEWYRMKFSLQSNALGELKAGFKAQSQLTGPQHVVRKTFPFSNERREVTIFFQSDLTDVGFCSFTNNYQHSEYWIDNIKLHRVQVQPQDPLDRHMLIYNSQSTAQDFPISGCWSDVHGVLHTGSVTLAPYSSIVLILEDDQLCGLSTGIDDEVADGQDQALVLFPNPALRGSEVFLTGTVEAPTPISLFDAQGRLVQQLQLAPGARSFQLDDGLLPGAYSLRIATIVPRHARLIVQ